MADIISANDGRALSSIGIGKAVVLKGDENSPVMRVVAAVGNQQGAPVGWACGWFTPGWIKLPDELLARDSQSSTWNMIQVAPEALELAPEPTEAH